MASFLGNFFDVRDIYFTTKSLCRHLNYSIRTNDDWYEVKYSAWKLWRELTQPFRFTKYFFWRLWKYRDVLLYDFDWDHDFLLEILKIKFLGMMKYHRDYGVTSVRDETALELLECYEIVCRLQKNNYSEAEDAAHDAKWGPLEVECPPALEYGTNKLGKPLMYGWNSYRIGVNTDKLKAQESKEQRAIWRREKQRKNADLRRLGKLFQNIERWWD